MMTMLNKLLADNRGLGLFKCEQGADEAVIYVYDVIVSDDYFDGVAADKFVQAVHGTKAPVIHLRINSPGGDVFAARAMEQALHEYPGKVIAHIDGYAASAASYLALAADEVHMAPGAFYMIHKAWTIVGGNADDLLHQAEILEKVDASLVDTYASATGQEKAQILQWMADETWFSAEESVEYGFATQIAKASPQAKRDGWNLSAYAHAPRVKEVEKESEPVEQEESRVTASTDYLRASLDFLIHNPNYTTA